MKILLIGLFSLACIAVCAQSAAEKTADSLLQVANQRLGEDAGAESRQAAESVLRMARGMPRQQANAYMYIGLSFKAEKVFDEALKNYRKALDLRWRVLRDTLATARTLNSMSSAYLDSSKPEEALAKAKEAEALYLSSPSHLSDSLRAMLYNNMANIFEKLDNIEEAIEINRKGLALFANTRDTLTKAVGEYGLAKRLIQQGEYEEAYEHLQIALSLPSSDLRQAHMYEALGIFFMRKPVSEVDSALIYFEKAKNLFLEFEGMEGELARIYFNIAEAHENKGDLENAQKAYQRASEYKPDELAEPAKFSELIAGRLDYLAEELQRRKVETWLFMALTSLIIALSIAAFYIYLSYKKERMNARANKLLYETTEKNAKLEVELFTLRHDKVKNSVNIIDRLITKNKTENTFKTFEQIKYEINELLVRLGYRSVTTEQNTLRSLAKALHMKAEITLGGSVVNLTDFDDMPDLPVPQEVSEELMLIVMEAFTNINKYAFDESSPYKTTSIGLEYHYENGLILTIEDKGKGFEVEKTLKSGLNNMQLKAKNLGWKLTILSAPGEGTSIRLVLPKWFG